MNITKWQRERIRDKIITHKFSLRDNALKTEENALAKEIYDLYVTAEDQRALDLLVQKHPNMFRMSASFYIQIVGCGSMFIIYENMLPGIDNPKFDDLPEAIQNKLIDYATRKIAFNTEMATDSRVLDATLERFKTVNKVRKEWPEIMPFVAEVMGDGTPVNLPAVNKDDLNSRFELPVEQAKAA